MTKLGAWFEDKPCIPLVGPLDVFLPDADETVDDIHTVVQPDVAVICGEDKIIEEGIRGAPDFVIEILSPSTAWRDQTQKRDLYEKHGVREFWIVNPESLEVAAWTKDDEKFSLPRGGSLAAGMTVRIFPGLTLKIVEKF